MSKKISKMKTKKDINKRIVDLKEILVIIKKDPSLKKDLRKFIQITK